MFVPTEFIFFEEARLCYIPNKMIAVETIRKTRSAFEVKRIVTLAAVSLISG